MAVLSITLINQYITIIVSILLNLKKPSTLQTAVSDQLSPTRADAPLQLRFHHYFQLTQVQVASAGAALPSHGAQVLFLPCTTSIHETEHKAEE